MGGSGLSHEQGVAPLVIFKAALRFTTEATEATEDTESTEKGSKRFETPRGHERQGRHPCHPPRPLAATARAHPFRHPRAGGNPESLRHGEAIVKPHPRMNGG